MNEAFTEGHALIIGVGADLANTVDDAIGLADILKDPARCAYPPEQVHLLTGPGATHLDIVSALETLTQSTTDESTVVVYFSGHGYRVTASIGEAYYLMPYGYDLGRLSQTAISGQEFAATLRAVPAKKLLVLLDCCHAGGVGETGAPGLDLAKAPLPAEVLPLLSRGEGRVLIASSKADELSYAGNPYSAFTLALIEALCGQGVAKQDGFARVSDLALHARQMVPSRTRDRQHPILHFEHADNFEVAFYAGGDTIPKALPFQDKPEIEPEPGAWRRMHQQAQTVYGPQTNVEGDVHGPVLSSQLGGPVSVGGGEAFDQRGAQGAIYEAGGNVEQQFGNRTTIVGDGNIIGDRSRSTVIKPATPGVSREEFARLLTEFQGLLPQAGLDEDTTAVVATDVAVVQQQAAKASPSAAIIVGKLKGITEILAAATGTVAAAGRLLPLIQKAIEWAGHLFH